MRQVLNRINRGGYEECSDCGGLILTDDVWLGEDKNGKGHFEVHYRCEDCGNYLVAIEPE